MCGLCGKYDAEREQEYRMPNGYVAKDAVSFGHSWILEEKPCRGGMQALINLVFINIIDLSLININNYYLLVINYYLLRNSRISQKI